MRLRAKIVYGNKEVIRGEFMTIQTVFSILSRDTESENHNKDVIDYFLSKYRLYEYFDYPNDFNPELFQIEITEILILSKI